MIIPESKYPAYQDNFDTVLDVRDGWSGGDFDLALEPELETRPSLSWPLAYFAMGTVFWLVRNTGWLGRLGWEGWPRRWSGFVLLGTEDHVVKALSDPAGRFHVVAGPDQKAMFRGIPNTLGVEGPEHLIQREIYLKVLRAPGRDIAAEMATVARNTAEALLDDARGDIDVIADLLNPVLAECAYQVHGMPREDPHALMTWTVRAAEQFVYPAMASELDMRRSFESARRLFGSQMRGLNMPHDEVQAGSTLDRLRHLREGDATLQAGTPDEISAKAWLSDDRAANIMMGLAFTLATQFLPGSQALNHVLRSDRRCRQAEALAKAGDHAGMRALVQENFRRHPATWPWVVRHVVLEKGTNPQFAPGVTLRDGETALIGIPSALRDGLFLRRLAAFFRNPSEKFNTQSPTLNGLDLAFGTGPHACMGQDMAETVVTEVFMALFARGGVKRTGPLLRRKGKLMPASLPTVYDAPAPKGPHVVATAAIPLRASVADIEARADALLKRVLRRVSYRLGRPAHAVFERQIRKAIEQRATRRIMNHMRRQTALALARVDSAPKDPVFANMCRFGGLHGLGVTLVDLTVNKEKRPFMVIEINADGPTERALDRLQDAADDELHPVVLAAGYGGTSLRTLFTRFMRTTSPRLHGDSGLEVSGISEWSVDQIEKEKRLSDFVETRVDSCLRDNPGLDAPLRALAAARRAVQEDPDLRALLLRPPSAAPGFARFRQHSLNGALRRWALRSLNVRLAALGLIALIGTLAALVTSAVATTSVWAALVVWIGAFLSLFMILAALLGLTGLALWSRIRAQEDTDPTDDRQPAIDRLSRTTAAEDAEGRRLNHLALVVELKTGFLRRFILTFAMWFIEWMSVHLFRPGWNANIGTIRHARFLSMAGAKEGVFLSSFDGSWSSYIGDFSDKATNGMSLFWSNCVGFPRTRALFQEGADDDEKFKRWVRGRQVPAALWRQRFPDLTNDTIRRNALIRDGLARELTRSEAERWLRLFGSVPSAVPDRLAPKECQSILFGGFGRFPASACVAVQIAPGQEDAFRDVIRKMAMPGQKGKNAPPTLCFGAAPDPNQGAIATFGLSAQGLVKLGAPSEKRGAMGAQLHHFPASFVQGMGRRARTLGDPLPQDDTSVRWIDKADGHAGNPAEVDAVFLLKAPAENDPEHINAARRAALDALLAALGDTIGKTPIVINTELPPSEHESDRARGLGFSDGVSQPLIKGAPGVPETSPFALAAGEFILGRPDEKGLRALSPNVPAAWDVHRDLPDHQPLPSGLWPDFSAPKAAGRDLGRDGTYMVIRQLEVRADLFKAEMDALSGSNPLPDADIAVKAIGRRRDGSPVGSPSFDPLADSLPPEPGARPMTTPAKDPVGLNFAQRDPFGYDVPIGSHVRRSHPRHSMDDPDQPNDMSHRHRIMRRGRAYVDQDGNEKGLLFVCLNASIERQFEFVQQTWINSPTFHRLFGEVDPLLGRGTRYFSIPSENGRRRVELKDTYVHFHGGGYFFAPGRAALRALTRPRGSKQG